MAAAFRETCAPVLYAMGFRHPKKVDYKRWAVTRRNFFARWRGDDYDEVTVFWWDLGRARFRLEFRARRLEPGQANPQLYRLMTGGVSRPVLGDPNCSDEFGQWLAPIGPTIARARSRLFEIDDWFRTGESTAHVWPHTDLRNYAYGDDPVYQDPWFFDFLPMREDLDDKPPRPSKR
jgi:hypothetical protein